MFSETLCPVLSNYIILLTFATPVVIIYLRGLVAWLGMRSRGCLWCNASILRGSSRQYQYQPGQSFALKDWGFGVWLSRLLHSCPECHHSCRTVIRPLLEGRIAVLSLSHRSSTRVLSMLLFSGTSAPLLRYLSWFLLLYSVRWVVKDTVCLRGPL